MGNDVDDEKGQIGAEIRARVTKGLSQRIKALAEYDGVTPAEWCRRAVRREVLRREAR